MNLSHVLCPIDFSEASRPALRAAAAIADYFGAALTVLTVDDPLLAEVAALTDPPLSAESARELERFVTDTLTRSTAGGHDVELTVAVGKPAVEILRAAAARHTSLVVMSSHGRSGARKMFFGSTAERVLRETSVPVLITPPDSPVDVSPATVARQVHRIIVPVDLSDASRPQVLAAARIATILQVPLLLAHVLEPVFVPYHVRLSMSGVDAARRERAEEQMAAIAADLTAGVQVETLVLTGDAAEEITKLVASRQANLIVMGLHSTGLLGPRIGSVTYRVLSLSRAPVLALPPAPPATS